MQEYKCDALHKLIPFVQFKKREKHTWRNVTFSEVAGFKFTESNSPPWVFLKFLKLYKWYQFAQNFPYNGRTVVITVTSPNLHAGVT